MTQIVAEAGEGALLSTLLQQLHIDIDFPCQGRQRCGKCKVRAEGDLSPLRAEEKALLSAEELSSGLRLACCTTAKGTVRLEVPQRSEAQILSAGVGEILPLQPLMEPGQYGAAIDTGTTTVVCYLFSAASGQYLASVCRLNEQRRYGADVISRICYSNEHSPEELHQVIIAQIGQMLDELCAEQGVERGLLRHATVTGNTAMLHYFAGLDPRGIGFAPFTPASLFDLHIPNALPGVDCYIPPCLSAYVGADLLCCLLASGAAARDELALVVDIGTNGEMALLDGKEIYCCSTAAGPAFEGASLSHGMPALAGAINSIDFDQQAQQLSFSTIHNAAPLGLCSSGLIEAAGLLLRYGALLPDGRLIADGHALEQYFNDDNGKVQFVFPDTDIAITQADIRQLQLAKSAIFAGMQTLLAEKGRSAGELSRLYLCGGFGSYVDLLAAEAIGLIPTDIRQRTVVLGNGAAAGAAQLLMQQPRFTELRRIKERCRYIELSASTRFMELYIDSMSFNGHT